MLAVAAYLLLTAQKPDPWITTDFGQPGFAISLPSLPSEVSTEQTMHGTMKEYDAKFGCIEFTGASFALPKDDKLDVERQASINVNQTAENLKGQVKNFMINKKP